MQKNSNPGITPYENLNIYYIKGALSPSDQRFDNSFIGNWEEDGFSFLFFSKPSREVVTKLVKTRTYLTLVDEYAMTYDEWHGERITPFRAGGLNIVPPWEKETVLLDQAPILLDPGVVFGTGTHTTTRDCLEAMEMAFRREKALSMIDMGTGTGLLAIAAVRHGCRSALAVDFNLLAARTAARNVRLNRLEKNIVAIQGMAEEFAEFPVDLMVANIHHAVMKKFIRPQSFSGKRQFILSGLLRSEISDIRERLTKCPVNIIKTWNGDGIWHTIYGKTY
jgi:ribosomal protein L11 methyltransferase